MFKRFLLLAVASLGFTMQASAQANCGATPASYAANSSAMPLLVTDLIIS